MKRIVLFYFLFCFSFQVWGQGVTTVIDTRTTRSNELTHDFPQGAQVFPVSFYAFSVRIEGRKLIEEINSVKILCINNNIATDSFDLRLSSESDQNGDEYWVSNLVFLDPLTQNIRLVLKTKSPIGDNVRNVTSRLFAPTNAKVDPKNQSPNGICERPPFIARSQWGAQWSLRDNEIYSGTPTITTVTHLVVHHGSSPNTATNYAAVVASYFDYHINTQGWADIGYNWLVAPDGTLFFGRGGGDNVQGAHFCAKNANTMGVCLIGDYQTVSPSTNMLTTLTNILAWKASQQNINVLGTAVHYGVAINQLLGHRDGCATDCPGQMTYAIFSDIKRNVAAKVAQCALRTSDFETVGNVSVSPNPIRANVLTLDISLKNIQPIAFHLLDANGKEVLQRIISQNAANFQEKIDVSEIPSGVYFVYIVVGDKFTTEKVVISR
jgi:hypothetical protein